MTTTHTTFIVRLHLERPQVLDDVVGLDSVSIWRLEEVFVFSSMRLKEVPWSNYAGQAYVIRDQCTESGEPATSPLHPSQASY
jgi:hypothetical protein